MSGSLRVRYDEVIDIHVLPDTAKCKQTDESPLNMDSCPILNFDTCGCECWPGDCEWYTEDEEASAT